MPRRNRNAYKRGPHRVRKGGRKPGSPPAPLTPMNTHPFKRIAGPQTDRR